MKHDDLTIIVSTLFLPFFIAEAKGISHSLIKKVNLSLTAVQQISSPNYAPGACHIEQQQTDNFDLVAQCRDSLFPFERHDYNNISSYNELKNPDGSTPYTGFVRTFDFFPQMMIRPDDISLLLTEEEIQNPAIVGLGDQGSPSPHAFGFRDFQAGNLNNLPMKFEPSQNFASSPVSNSRHAAEVASLISGMPVHYQDPMFLYNSDHPTNQLGCSIAPGDNTTVLFEPIGADGYNNIVKLLEKTHQSNQQGKFVAALNFSLGPNQADSSQIEIFRSFFCGTGINKSIVQPYINSNVAIPNSFSPDQKAYILFKRIEKQNQTTIVFAAGNEGKWNDDFDGCKENFENVAVVGASKRTNSNELLSRGNIKSNFGEQVDFVTIGDLLTTLGPGDNNAMTKSTENRFFTGTSGAAPQITGSLIILKKIIPNLPSTLSLNLLKITATPFQNSDVAYTEMKAGLPNLPMAVEFLRYLKSKGLVEQLATMPPEIQTAKLSQYLNEWKQLETYPDLLSVDAVLNSIASSTTPCLQFHQSFSKALYWYQRSGKQAKYRDLLCDYFTKLKFISPKKYIQCPDSKFSTDEINFLHNQAPNPVNRGKHPWRENPIGDV